MAKMLTVKTVKMGRMAKTEMMLMVKTPMARV